MIKRLVYLTVHIIIWNKFTVTNRGFINYYFFSFDLLGISKYFHVNMQGIVFNAAFLQFWTFLIVYIIILGRDHVKLNFISSIHSWNNIILYQKKLWFGRHAILSLKNCICRRNLNFSKLYLLMPDRSHDK